MNIFETIETRHISSFAFKIGGIVAQSSSDFVQVRHKLTQKTKNETYKIKNGRIK